MVLEIFIVAGNTFVEPSIVVDNLKTTTRQLYCLGQIYFVFKRFCRAENIFEKLFAQYKMFCDRIPSKSVISASCLHLFCFHNYHYILIISDNALTIMQ